jgi:hypothetical protein
MARWFGLVIDVLGEAVAPAVAARAAAVFGGVDSLAMAAGAGRVPRIFQAAVGFFTRQQDT